MIKSCCNISMACLMLSGCIFARPEPSINEFSSLEDRFRACAIRQAEIRVQDGSALAMGHSESAYEVSSACLATLHAEDSEITDTARATASRSVKMPVGAQYYRRQCKQPSFSFEQGCGWSRSTYYNITPNHNAYSYFTPERELK